MAQLAEEAPVSDPLDWIIHGPAVYLAIPAFFARIFWFMPLVGTLFALAIYGVWVFVLIGLFRWVWDETSHKLGGLAALPVTVATFLAPALLIPWFFLVPYGGYERDEARRKLFEAQHISDWEDAGAGRFGHRFKARPHVIDVETEPAPRPDPLAESPDDPLAEPEPSRPRPRSRYIPPDQRVNDAEVWRSVEDP